MQQIYNKNNPQIQNSSTDNAKINFNTEDSEYTEPSLALLKLSQINNKSNQKMIVETNPLNNPAQLSRSIASNNENSNNETEMMLNGQNLTKSSGHRMGVSLSIGSQNDKLEMFNTGSKSVINNDAVSTPDLSSIGFSNLENNSKRKYDGSILGNNENEEESTLSLNNKKLKTSQNATPSIDNFAFNEEYDEDFDTSKLPRATIEQKLAIIEFFKSYKADIPRFKLVNMFNKKISISISSLSSWLKNETSLIEKYMKKYRCSDLSMFNFRKIIQDLVDSEVPDHHENPNHYYQYHNSENKASGSRNGSTQLSGDEVRDPDLNKKSQRSKYHQINKMMDKIVTERKSQNLPINESVLKEYWIKFYPTCGLTDAKRAKGPSNGWLDNFKNKHELKNYDASSFEFDFKKVGLQNCKQNNKSNNVDNVDNDSSPFGAPLVSLPENLKKDKAIMNTVASHGSTVSAQSGLYITKPSKNESDYEKPLNPHSMGISTSGKIETTLNDDLIRNNNNIVPLTTTTSINVPGHNASTDFIQSNVKFLSSQNDLSNHQESTDSFFKKFGSGIFNFNNASSKDLENVNAFFQQQKQTQQYNTSANGLPLTSQNSANNENDSQQPKTPKKVESNILWWFKNNANQQLPISSGLSFFNLSSYNKNQLNSIPSHQQLESLPGSDRSDSKTKEQTQISATAKSADLNEDDITSQKKDGITQSPQFSSPQNNVSQPTLAQANQLFSSETSATGSQVSARFSQILSSNSFKNNISNSIKQLKKSRGDDYEEDGSDDSDGGLEINVPQNFKQEEIELLMKVHISKFLKKNKKSYPQTLSKLKELLDVFEEEKSSKTERSLKDRLEDKSYPK